MDQFAIVGYLRARADRCRGLAEKASDPEVAEALRQLADDIDVTIPFVNALIQKAEDRQP